MYDDQQCGECGRDDGTPEFVECCGVWMCEMCLDKHEAKWGSHQVQGE